MTELELDEKALAKAAQAVGVDMWRVPANPATIARAAVTAYLAARPTPDAEAMERAFREALNDLIDAAHDEGRAQERGYATTGERGAAEAAVMALFRKAAAR